MARPSKPFPFKVSNQGKLPVKKIDAAVSQLETAIQLWFHDQDPVSTCTLAHAGHEIMRQLAIARKIPGHSILDFKFDSPEISKALRELIKSSPNFFKHGGSSADEIHYLPDKLIHLIIMDAINLYTRLGFKAPPLFCVFAFWHAISSPHLLNKTVSELLSRSVNPVNLNKVAKLNKRDFFNRMLNALVRLDGPSDSVLGGH